MKFYEKTFVDYIHTVKKCNLHPELESVWKKFPKNINHFPNLIFYGPSGVGKYSQMLYCISQYGDEPDTTGSSIFKCDKKITSQYNKQTYVYHISDIHYEVDMNLLGCNSKLLWNEIFIQIFDIISIKMEKVGIIVCKNFHNIHNELLDFFYSYIQEYNSLFSNIKIKFILLTEHLSFIPNNIVDTCKVINVRRPEPELYKRIIPTEIIHRPIEIEIPSTQEIKNIKEFISVVRVAATKTEQSRITVTFPEKPFHLICNTIISHILNYKKLSFVQFRDIIYEIFIYNLDIFECILYIFSHLIRINFLNSTDITKCIVKLFPFFQYYNNNYRPIYHLESFFVYIILLKIESSTKTIQ